MTAAGAIAQNITDEAVELGTKLLSDSLSSLLSVQLEFIHRKLTNREQERNKVESCR